VDDCELTFTIEKRVRGGPALKLALANAPERFTICFATSWVRRIAAFKFTSN
jgi:hypothetical protein